MAFYKKNNPSEATNEVDDDYITAVNGIKYQNIKSGEDELREVLQPGDSVKIQPIVYYNGIKIDKKYGALLTPTEYIVPYTPDMQLHELTFLGYPYLHEALRLFTYLPNQSQPYLLTYLHRGMDIGGKRRIIFPAKMAFTKEYHPTIIPDDGTILVEATVTKHVANA